MTAQTVAFQCACGLRVEATVPTVYSPEYGVQLLKRSATSDDHNPDECSRLALLHPREVAA